MRSTFRILLLFFISFSGILVSYGQNSISVNGVVTDENGDPLKGATVSEKGTKVTTITDVNGKFSLKVADKSSVVVISFVGMLTQEIPIRNLTEFNVSLSPNPRRAG